MSLVRFLEVPLKPLFYRVVFLFYFHLAYGFQSNATLNPLSNILLIAKIYYNIRKFYNTFKFKLGFLTKFAFIINNIKTIKMAKSIFYHAGCPVCVSAEHDIINLVGEDNVEIVHLGDAKDRIAEAELAGVKSVPALVTPTGNVLHINFGASMEDVKA